MESPKRYGSEKIVFEKNPKKVKKIFIPQLDSLSCGPAAFSMITASLGNWVPVSKARKVIEMTQHGSSLYGIVHAADSFGLETCSVEIDYDLLKDVRLPAIIHFEASSENFMANIDHFVVLFEVKDDRVVIGDPSYGIMQMDRKTFNSRWSGVVLVFKETEDFFKQRHDQTGPLSVQSLLRSNRKTLGLILSISMFLTVFAILPTKILGDIYDRIGKTSPTLMASLKWMAFALVFSRFLTMVIRYLRDLLSLKLSVRMGYRMTHKIHQQALLLPLKEIATRKTGEILSSIEGVHELGSFVSHVFIGAMVDLFMASAFFFTLFLIDWRFSVLAIAALVIILIYSYFLAKWVRDRTYPLLIESATADHLLIQNMRYSQVIKSLGSERHFIQIWSSRYKKLYKKQFKFNANLGALKKVDSIVQLIVDYSMLIMSFYLFVDGKITLGGILMAQTYISQFLAPIYGLTDAYDTLQKAGVSLERANDLFAVDRETSGNVSLLQVPSIHFNRVFFSYENTSQGGVLNGFDLKIQPGEFILLVGKSGSGKSTLIQLLLRLYDPNQGSISFNDIDLKEFKLSSLRNRIGYVSQEPLLLPLNIEQNIAFGEEIINEDRLISALKESNSLEFIRGLKRGVKTIISEDGKGLSGGQKQRIALARALYRDPALLLLDEPTSALDRESEKEIVEAIRKLKRNKTIILCTHKAEAFDFADRVIEIADGKTLEKN